MKVLLVYPYFLEARIHVEEIAAVPMGVYYVGAMLKAHGHSVEIVNWHRRPDSQDELKEALISYRPGIIGFLLCTPIGGGELTLPDWPNRSIRRSRWYSEASAQHFCGVIY